MKFPDTCIAVRRRACADIVSRVDEEKDAGRAPPMPRQQIARPNNKGLPNRSFRRHWALCPSVKRRTEITVAVSRQYKNTARGKLICTSVEDNLL